MKKIDIHTHHTPRKRGEGVLSIDVNLWRGDTPPIIGGVFSIGIHPWSVNGTSDEVWGRLEKYAKHPNCILIGECGLDKLHEEYLRQHTVFERQIDLSERLKKPMIIHCVKAFNDLMTIRKEMAATQEWIVHGFRGKPQLAMQLIACGLSLSFGVLHNVESVKVCPLDKLYLETDDSTIDIASIYTQIANVKGCEVSALTAGERLLNSVTDSRGRG